MRKLNFAAAASISAAVVLTACSSSGSSGAQQSGSPTAPKVGPSVSASGSVGAVPSPDASQSTALLAALGKINSGFNDPTSIDKARDVCTALRSGSDTTAVQQKAKSSFEGGSVSTLTAEQIGAIVAAVQSTFCPSSK